MNYRARKHVLRRYSFKSLLIYSALMICIYLVWKYFLRRIIVWHNWYFILQLSFKLNSKLLVIKSENFIQFYFLSFTAPTIKYHLISFNYNLINFHPIIKHNKFKQKWNLEFIAKLIQLIMVDLVSYPLYWKAQHFSDKKFGVDSFMSVLKKINIWWSSLFYLRSAQKMKYSNLFSCNHRTF